MLNTVLLNYEIKILTQFRQLRTKVLINFIILFRYTLMKRMTLNRVNVSVHRELINGAMLQICSSTEFII